MGFNQQKYGELIGFNQQRCWCWGWTALLDQPGDDDVTCCVQTSFQSHNLLVHWLQSIMCNIYNVYCLHTHTHNIWWFPEIGVPPNHPLQWDCPYKPSISGYPHDYGNPHLLVEPSECMKYHRPSWMAYCDVRWITRRRCFRCFKACFDWQPPVD